MCYAKPGPRCAGHSKKKLELARQDVQHKESRIVELQGRMAKNPMSLSQSEALELNTLLRERPRYRAALNDAKREYYATRGGQKELTLKIEQAQRDGDAYTQYAASLDLYTGIATHEAQRQAYANAMRDDTVGQVERPTAPALLPKVSKERLLTMRAQANPNYDGTIAPLMDEGFTFEPAEHPLSADPHNLTTTLVKRSPAGGSFLVRATAWVEGESMRNGGVSAWWNSPEGAQIALTNADTTWRTADYEQAADTCPECKRVVGRNNMEHFAYASRACADCAPATRQRHESPGWNL